MTDIIWGETHCPFCEKPLPNAAQCAEADRVEGFFGTDSHESEEYDAQFCWWPAIDCRDYEAARGESQEYTRVIDLLKQRDALRAALSAAGGAR